MSYWAHLFLNCGLRLLLLYILKLFNIRMQSIDILKSKLHKYNNIYACNISSCRCFGTLRRKRSAHQPCRGSVYLPHLMPNILNLCINPLQFLSKSLSYWQNQAESPDLMVIGRYNWIVGFTIQCSHLLNLADHRASGDI